MNEFIRNVFSGVSLGGIYALVALGYVIVYRATHTLNFAQGQVMVLGAYITYWLSGPVRGVNFDTPPSFFHIPLWPALVISMIVCGAIGWLLELGIIRKFRGRPVFASIMATLGVGVVLGALTNLIWGSTLVTLNSPLGTRSNKIFGIRVAQIDLVTLFVVGLISVVFFFGFQRSKLGTAMKATAFDQEAAIAQGISPKVIFGASWAISCALAAIAGTLMATGAGSLVSGVSANLGLFAFFGFPAIVLGGVDSLEGAAIGGIVIGLVQQMTAAYAPHIEKWVGFNFYNVTPFLVMIVVLLIRPAGLFGTREVRRV